MNAIILAAGMGNRFEPEPLSHPKCLLEFGGKSLLARSIENLAWAGCDRVTVIAGYQAEKIQAEMERLAALLPIDLLFNSKYDCGSAGSVLCAADIFENEPTLMLDADFLYDRRILTLLVHAQDENVLLVDCALQETKSECWVTGQGSRITGMYIGTHKEPSAIGVYWGMHKFSPRYGKAFVRVTRTMFEENPKTEYWHPVSNLFDEIVMGYVDTGDMMYCEMDTWQDVEWARTHVYPHLLALGQG